MASAHRALDEAFETQRELVDSLWECMKWAGADTSFADGADHAFRLGSLPQEAVEAVKALRADYDECPTPEDLQKALGDRDTAWREILRLRAGLESIAENSPHAESASIAQAVLDNEDTTKGDGHGS